MKRYRVDFSYGRYFFEERPDGDWVKYEDHEAIIRRQADAYLSGMDAATEISSRQLHLAQKARAESSPTVLESERAANAQLTQELSLAEEGLANAMQERQQLLADLDRLREVNRIAISRAQQEIDQLRTTLRGVASCSTREVCRGAALSALPQLEKP